MSRRLPTRLGTAALIGALAWSLVGCSPEAEVAATPASEASTPMSASAAEGSFLAATAAHLCTVQSGVYDDAAELAAAYAASAEYDGLSAAQIAELTARLTADPAFSEQLREAIADTCG